MYCINLVFPFRFRESPDEHFPRNHKDKKPPLTSIVYNFHLQVTAYIYRIVMPYLKTLIILISVAISSTSFSADQEGPIPPMVATKQALVDSFNPPSFFAIGDRYGSGALVQTNYNSLAAKAAEETCDLLKARPKIGILKLQEYLMMKRKGIAVKNNSAEPERFGMSRLKEWQTKLKKIEGLDPAFVSELSYQDADRGLPPRRYSKEDLKAILPHSLETTLTENYRSIAEEIKVRFQSTLGRYAAIAHKPPVFEELQSEDENSRFYVSIFNLPDTDFDHIENVRLRHIFEVFIDTSSPSFIYANYLISTGKLVWAIGEQKIKNIRDEWVTASTYIYPMFVTPEFEEEMMHDEGFDRYIEETIMERIIRNKIRTEAQGILDAVPAAERPALLETLRSTLRESFAENVHEIALEGIPVIKEYFKAPDVKVFHTPADNIPSFMEILDLKLTEALAWNSALGLADLDRRIFELLWYYGTAVAPMRGNAANGEILMKALYLYHDQAIRMFNNTIPDMIVFSKPILSEMISVAQENLFAKPVAASS